MPLRHEWLFRAYGVAMPTRTTLRIVLFRAAVFAALVALPLLHTSMALAEERKAYLVDEAANDPSFVDFRAGLLDALVRRDTDFVVAQAAPDIQLSFGGHYGRDDFRRFLTLSQDDLADEYRHEAAQRRESYWAALEETIRMGGRFTSSGAFEAPYTSTAPLAESDDPYTTYFVVGKDVPLRNRPSRFGDVVAMLDHDIVTSLDGGEGTAFQEIRLADSRSGFVDRSSLRSAIDHRAVFEKHDGSWQMVTFLAGD